MVSCQKGPTRHAYAWQIEPFWQHTLGIVPIHNCQWCTANCKSNIGVCMKLCDLPNELLALVTNIKWDHACSWYMLVRSFTQHICPASHYYDHTWITNTTQCPINCFIYGSINTEAWYNEPSYQHNLKIHMHGLTNLTNGPMPLVNCRYSVANYWIMYMWGQHSKWQTMLLGDLLKIVNLRNYLNGSSICWPQNLTHIY